MQSQEVRWVQRGNDLDDQLLPYTIDLSIFKNIRNSEMVQQIERVGIAFYRK